MVQRQHQPQCYFARKGLHLNCDFRWIMGKQPCLPINLRRNRGYDGPDKTASLRLAKLARFKEFDSFLVSLPRIVRLR